MPHGADMRTKPTRQEKKAATRERLLAAGADLVLENGFHRTSLDAIAAEAGVTKGAVYSNFPSKAEFLMEIAERVVPDRPSPATPRGPVSNMAETLVAQAHENPDHWRRLIEFI